MQGYTLTGRHALFPSYESFLGIVQTMIEVGCNVAMYTVMAFAKPQPTAIRQILEDGSRNEMEK